VKFTPKDKTRVPTEIFAKKQKLICQKTPPFTTVKRFFAFDESLQSFVS